MEKSIPIEAAPLYRQIHYELRDLIVSGKMLPGESLPSEKDIGQKYGVSRFTIQQVFRLLVQEGLVYRRQGLGTFVRELEGTDKAERITLQLGGLQCASHLQMEALQGFTRRVAEMTRNQVHIRITRNSVLGSASRQLKQVAGGNQDMFSAGTDWLEQLEPSWGVTNLPFLFQNIAHVHAFAGSEIAESLRVKLLKENIRVLADNWIGASRLILALRPCFEVEDFVGLRLRVPAIPTYHQIWGAIGASPVEMPWDRILEGLENNEIQAIDVPRDIAQQEGFHCRAHYVTNTRHLFPRLCILISEKAFSALRSDIQQVLLVAAKEAGEDFSTASLAKSSQDKQRMVAEGARFIETDTAPFRKMTAALYQSNPEFQDYIEAIVGMQAETSEEVPTPDGGGMHDN